jgi:hypothetical protein
MWYSPGHRRHRQRARAGTLENPPRRPASRFSIRVSSHRVVASGHHLANILSIAFSCSSSSGAPRWRGDDAGRGRPSRLAGAGPHLHRYDPMAILFGGLAMLVASSPLLQGGQTPLALMIVHGPAYLSFLPSRDQLDWASSPSPTWCSLRKLLNYVWSWLHHGGDDRLVESMLGRGRPRFAGRTSSPGPDGVQATLAGPGGPGVVVVLLGFFIRTHSSSAAVPGSWSPSSSSSPGSLLALSSGNPGLGRC